MQRCYDIFRKRGDSFANFHKMDMVCSYFANIWKGYGVIGRLTHGIFLRQTRSRSVKNAAVHKAPKYGA